MKVEIRIPFYEESDDVEDEVIKICSVYWDMKKGTLTGDDKGIEFMNWLIEKAKKDKWCAGLVPDSVWITDPLNNQLQMTDMLRQAGINIPEVLFTNLDCSMTEDFEEFKMLQTMTPQEKEDYQRMKENICY